MATDWWHKRLTKRDLQIVSSNDKKTFSFPSGRDRNEQYPWTMRGFRRLIQSHQNLMCHFHCLPWSIQDCQFLVSLQVRRIDDWTNAMDWQRHSDPSLRRWSRKWIISLTASWNHRQILRRTESRKSIEQCLKHTQLVQHTVVHERRKC